MPLEQAGTEVRKALILEPFAQWLKQENHTALLLLLITGLSVISFLLVLVLLARQNRLQKRIHAMTAGLEGANIEQVLTHYLSKVDTAERQMQTLEQMVGVLQAQIPHCFQRAHLIRYDAFEDVGGQQSFSVVLLDAKRDGLVISGVYNRMDMRVYAKYLSEGCSSHPLSQEEERAVRECLSK